MATAEQQRRGARGRNPGWITAAPQSRERADAVAAAERAFPILAMLPPFNVARCFRPLRGNKIYQYRLPLRGKPMKQTAERPEGRPRRASRRAAILGFAIALAVAGGAWWWHDHVAARPAARAPAPVPVTVAQAARRDVPIFLDALGTIQAANTIAVRSQIDGKLQSVQFQEGQQVHQGDTLAVIDPRPFQAALDQAVAKKAEDQAQLVSAAKDLTRSKELAGKGYGTQQSVDQQQGKVDQLRATVDADQAAGESAQTQLSYATITAPIDGRVGFRQVDAGNVVHANDANPLTVITQIRPIMAVFALPQKNLVDVREAMLRGEVPVQALDQDDKRKLADGTLLLIDNQIDQTTSTIRLKARFPNEDDRLWPGEFVRLRAQVDTRKDAVTIPSVALQRGPQGFYAWVITPDDTAEQRAVAATTVDNDLAIVTKGIETGERVVVNGQYRLQGGVRVEVKSESAAEVAQRSP
jgi:multidrug efflux system membrane fusion protein